MSDGKRFFLHDERRSRACMHLNVKLYFHLQLYFLDRKKSDTRFARFSMVLKVFSISIFVSIRHNNQSLVNEVMNSFEILQLIRSIKFYYIFYFVTDRDLPVILF